MKRLTTLVATLATAGLITDGISTAAEPRLVPPATLGAQVVPAVDATNAFGIDLYRALAKANPAGNLFISPYSMSVALTMAADGASGETESEMARVLHFPVVSAAGGRAITPMHEAFMSLSQRLTAAGTTDPATKVVAEELRTRLASLNEISQKAAKAENWAEASRCQTMAQAVANELNILLTQIERFDLRVANALWVERSYDLQPEYVRTIGRYYGSGGVTPLDIARDAEGSRTRINTWVADHTEQRIKDVVPPGGLPAQTRLVITNAVYFKGQWASPFHENSTKEESFTIADGSSRPVKMMNDGWRWTSYTAISGDGSPFATPHKVPKDESKRPATYPDDAGFTIIELPYKGGDLSMLVLLPRTAAGLPALEERLSPAALTRWLQNAQDRTVTTAVPRFKVESAIDAAPTLQALGMRRAFTDADPNNGGAQFPGLSASSDPTKQLYIGSVLHKAWVDVAEKGTEAAAATVVTFPSVSAAPHREETVPFTPVFRADHPFLFIIRDTESGVFLFMGRVSEPQAG